MVRGGLVWSWHSCLRVYVIVWLAKSYKSHKMFQDCSRKSKHIWHLSRRTGGNVTAEHSCLRYLRIQSGGYRWGLLIKTLVEWVKLNAVFMDSFPGRRGAGRGHETSTITSALIKLCMFFGRISDEGRHQENESARVYNRGGSWRVVWDTTETQRRPGQYSHHVIWIYIRFNCHEHWYLQVFIAFSDSQKKELRLLEQQYPISVNISPKGKKPTTMSISCWKEDKQHVLAKLQEYQALFVAQDLKSREMASKVPSCCH